MIPNQSVPRSLSQFGQFADVPVAEFSQTLSSVKSIPVLLAFQKSFGT